MGVIKDITGQKFGMLTAIRYIRPDYWLFLCDCGKEKICNSSNVRRGFIKSCGCYRAAVEKATAMKYRKDYKRIHNIWTSMKQRCFNKKSTNSKWYFGRGIKVCQEWSDSFEVFYDWAVSNGYKNNLTIDRIDPNKDYCPENCRWITFAEQQTNRTNTPYVEYCGKKIKLKDLAKSVGLPQWKIYQRIHRYKWDLVRAITTPAIIIICLTGCCQNTSVQIKPVCPPMLREATYKAMQADEVADYRIAVEKCRVF